MTPDELRQRNVQLSDDVIKLVIDYTKETGIVLNQIVIDTIETTEFGDQYPQYVYGTARFESRLP